MIARVSFFFTLLTALVAQAGESTYYALDPVILGSAGGAGSSITFCK